MLPSRKPSPKAPLKKVLTALFVGCGITAAGACTGFLVSGMRTPPTTQLVVQAPAIANASTVEPTLGSVRTEVDGASAEDLHAAPTIHCPELTPVDPPWLVVGPPPPPEAEPPAAPRSLERRIKFWLRVWGERGDNQHFLVDQRRPWVVHTEVDCRDLFSEGADASALQASKDACGGRITQARRAVQAKLKASATSRATLALFDGDRKLAKTAADHVMAIQGRRDALARAKVRAEPGLGLAEGHFANADVPRLYARAAIVESLWRPEALSRSGAGGVYQFMPKTGRQFLTVEDGGVDERLDPLRSAWAAAKYMAKMAKEFKHNWPLVLTAYNTGPARLKKVMKARHSEDIGRIADAGDFGEFGFDGQNYYAQIAAIGRLTATDRFEPKPITGRAFRVDNALDFSKLAACTEIGATALAAANPALGQDVVAGKLPVPVGYVAHVPTPPITTASR